MSYTSNLASKMQNNIVGRALAVLPGKAGGKESGST